MQKKRYLYRERKAEQRTAFVEQIKLIEPHNRVYVDEAGIEDTLDYAYGWSLRGTGCPGERLGHRTQRISLIAAWCQANVLAPLTFEGYCHSLLVETWFEECLLPVLRREQVVILDTAWFHRKAHLARLLAKVGCTLLALPPYSPDLNRIEPLWNTLKQRIPLQVDASLNFGHKVDAAFCSLSPFIRYNWYNTFTKIPRMPHRLRRG